MGQSPGPGVPMPGMLSGIWCGVALQNVALLSIPGACFIRASLDDSYLRRGTLSNQERLSRSAVAERSQSSWRLMFGLSWDAGPGRAPALPFPVREQYLLGGVEGRARYLSDKGEPGSP